MRPEMGGALRTGVPALLFGLRLAASVCLSLYIAFWLQLDNPYWAAVSAAAVSQPSLGASLRKGWYRMVGTLVGAVFIVVLTACCVQNRAAFLITLALWGAVCTLAATVLHNFSSYAAALAGFTAAIVASDELGATGGANGDAFMLAVTRASEICIGIVCAGVVLAATDFGGARRRLATVLGGLTRQVTNGFVEELAVTGAQRRKSREAPQARRGEPDAPDTRPARREFIRQVIALDPVVDQAIGESSQLRHYSPLLAQAVFGLVDALAGWRTVACHRLRLSHEQRLEHEADVVLEGIAHELRPVPHETQPSPDIQSPHVAPAALRGIPSAALRSSPWITDPVGLLRACQKSVRALLRTPAGTPSRQLLADQSAKALLGIAKALRGVALLVTYPARPGGREPRFRLERSGRNPTKRRRRDAGRLQVPDWAPALSNAGRAFVAIGAAELFWVVTAWPSGATLIAWTAITVVLFGPRAEQAYTGALRFLLGNSIAAASAAIVEFAVLPQLETFAGLGTTLACYLVPTGAMIALGWQAAVFVPMAVNFVPLLTPANVMSYDTVTFYNSSLALVAGNGLAILAFRVLPPLSPAVRTRRLLTLTLRDLRRLARGPMPATSEGWERRIFARIAALPDSAEPLQRAQILAALVAGTELNRLHRLARRLHLTADLEPAADALARGQTTATNTALARLDRSLAETPRVGRSLRLALHARGSVLALSEVLDQHAPYFGAAAPA
jgi:uncharacterized membrane protein YccC